VLLKNNTRFTPQYICSLIGVNVREVYVWFFKDAYIYKHTASKTKVHNVHGNSAFPVLFFIFVVVQGATRKILGKVQAYLTQFTCYAYTISRRMLAW
jgi:hypothetical protein